MGGSESVLAPSQPHRANVVATAAATANIVVSRFHGVAPATLPPSVADIPTSANAGFARASANFAALSNRSAANFSNDFATAAATFVGTDWRSLVTGAAGSVTICMMICWADDPVCGGSPVNISYKTLPNE